jgi:hypothetical protein
LRDELLHPATVSASANTLAARTTDLHVINCHHLECAQLSAARMPPRTVSKT